MRKAIRKATMNDFLLRPSGDINRTPKHDRFYASPTLYLDFYGISIVIDCRSAFKAPEDLYVVRSSSKVS